MELKQYKPEDLLEIKGNLVESKRTTPDITLEIANYIATLGNAYTCFKDGKVVACAGTMSNEQGVTDIWAFYSADFSCFTRARAALEFHKHIAEVVGRVRISIPSDLPNGDKYAKFLGFKFTKKETSKLFSEIENSIYEVT